jgi:DNA mismatch repair protein MutS
MTFHSILWEEPRERGARGTAEMPAFFVDLNLDQVVDAIASGKEEYDLKPFFYFPLPDLRAVRYRQEIMRDLENLPVFSAIESFAHKMRAMREHRTRADQLRFTYQKEAWFLEAVEIYCDAVTSLAEDLAVTDLKSGGLSAFREYLRSYIETDRFRSLAQDTSTVKAELAAVKYCIVIRDNALSVRKYEEELDYSVEVERTFERFKQRAVKDYRVTFRTRPEMNHVEEKVLEFVSRLYPETFAKLNDYYTTHSGYLEKTIAAFDREIQFYVAYLQYLSAFKRAGLKVCYPAICRDRKDVYDCEGFDLALATKLISEHSVVICNDFHLRGSEHILVVTGPNQGGKTTFARTFGQLHYMASLGCPVPGTAARLFLFDRLFTHFEKEEDIRALRGSLEDSLSRIHAILTEATPRSIVIINEMFNSTTLHDAQFLSKKVLEKVMDLDLLCICVTFIDELASLSDKTVSMVATVAPENPGLRTYKILKKPADGRAWAISIAEKHRLTYDSLKERLGS